VDVLDKKKTKWRTRSALIGTGIWLAVAVWWTFYRPCTAWAVPTMDPNAWGDWAGGTFAPLAFLWLVVGYFQQGEELRDNVRALRLQEEALQLQVKELKESVEQQTAMAKASARQAELLERNQEIALRAQVLAHQPRFVGFHGIFLDEEMKRLTFSVSNEGVTCYDVAVFAISTTDEVPFPEVFSVWHAETGQQIVQVLDVWPVDKLGVEITYRDAHLVGQSQKFEIDVSTTIQTEKPLRVELVGMTFNLPPQGA
jgi:hypothetical protein